MMKEMKMIAGLTVMKVMKVMDEGRTLIQFLFIYGHNITYFKMKRVYTSNKEFNSQCNKILTENLMKRDNPIIILSATHGARMGCMLEDILYERMKKYREDNRIRAISLKNCCILKLSLDRYSDNASISLCYEGEIVHREPGGYW